MFIYIYECVNCVYLPKVGGGVLGPSPNPTYKKLFGELVPATCTTPVTARDKRASFTSAGVNWSSFARIIAAAPCDVKLQKLKGVFKY